MLQYEERNYYIISDIAAVIVLKTGLDQPDQSIEPGTGQIFGLGISKSHQSKKSPLDCLNRLETGKPNESSQIIWLAGFSFFRKNNYREVPQTPQERRDRG